VKRIGVLLIAFAVALPTLADTKTVALDVKGWTCGSCAVSTRIALKKLEGVQNVKTDHEKAEVIVTYDDSKVTPQRLIQAVERIGYSATVKGVVDAMPVPTTKKSTAQIGLPQSNLVPEEVSFFEVPLECGAAADLGCGSAAKPILRELEKDARVATAKINHPGTVLAVVWKEPNLAPAGIPFVVSAFEKNDSETVILRGPDREKALREYEAGKWYGPADVDRLSEREAEVIASRLVTRARLGLAPDVEKALTHDLSAVFARHLTSDSPSDRAIVEDDLVKAAGKYLNSSQMDQLLKAGEKGVRALPGEAK
jgi:mercuric transport protein